MKRALDLMLACTALILSAPLLAAAALVVRVALGRPILFRDERLGRDERPFTLYKFRTMTDARDRKGNLLADAVRLTLVGRALRRLSLDELPQLWNVVRGDMSLVGPRPLPVRYRTRLTPTERRRHNVRPGITGWAQVHGRNAVPWDDRLRLDVWYVDHRSLHVDLRVIGRTLALVLRGEGVKGSGSAATMDELRPGRPEPN